MRWISNNLGGVRAMHPQSAGRELRLCRSSGSSQDGTHRDRWNCRFQCPAAAIWRYASRDVDDRYAADHPRRWPAYSKNIRTTHDIIRQNFPSLYGGVMKGAPGCPSIEDKVVRLQTDHHQIFIEPEGLGTSDSTQRDLHHLPYDVRWTWCEVLTALVRPISPAPAIEYDFDPRGQASSKRHLLMGCTSPGRSTATGYRAQPVLIAGINAAASRQT